MTVIAVSKLNNKSLFVVDAIVQIDLRNKTHTQCRLQDKITKIESSHQFITLCGEGLISDGIGLLSHWCDTQNKILDLTKEEHILEALTCADLYRKYSEDIQESPRIEQESTMIYLLYKSGVNLIHVEFKNNNYVISKVEEIEEGKLFINYKGNIKEVSINEKIEDLVELSKSEIIKEHEWRKTEGINQGKNPLPYNFDNRYSALLIENGEIIYEEKPFKEFTDLFLMYSPSWDYVNSESFKYSPKI